MKRQVEDSAHTLHILKLLLEDLQRNHNLPPERALKLAFSDDRLTVPASIFVQELTILEAVTKHLKENNSLKLSEIARLLKRTPRSIWGSFKLAEKKHPASLPKDPASVRIPIELFSHEILSPSQILVMCLFDEHKMRFAEIAKLLHRDARTIWAMYNTGKNKMQKEGRQ